MLTLGLAAGGWSGSSTVLGRSLLFDRIKLLFWLLLVFIFNLFLEMESATLSGCFVFSFIFSSPMGVVGAEYVASPCSFWLVLALTCPAGLAGMSLEEIVLAGLLLPVSS